MFLGTLFNVHTFFYLHNLKKSQLFSLLFLCIAKRYVCMVIAGTDLINSANTDMYIHRDKDQKSVINGSKVDSVASFLILKILVTQSREPNMPYIYVDVAIRI